jgi:hypothetical protein
MGGGTSKMVPAPLTPLVAAPKFDWTKATVSGADLEQYQAQVAASVKSATELANKKLLETSGSWTKWFIITVVGLLFIFGAILGYDALAIHFGWPTALLPGRPSDIPPITPISNILIIQTATYGTGSTTQDVTSVLRGMVKNDISTDSFIVSHSTLGLPSDPVPNVLNTLNVTYYIGYGDTPNILNVNSGQVFPALPTGKETATEHFGNIQASTKMPPPPMLTKVFNFLTGSNSSGDLLSNHDTTTATTIAATSAPMSAQKEGAYGMQWWMFVKDWNYAYGKDKAIIRRTDPTNSGVVNPQISLHPTDNILRVSIAVYSHDGGPAAANHDGTDDVFVCEVPNIPLQSWFSVSVTVFGRNVDIYINGKLVKSCFTTGVPKPAYGDINVTPDGGFSGRMCGFYHYPRMLVPEDALAFWSAGTPCSTSDGNTPLASATGYSVKFGMYDTMGKEVQEYSF